MFVLRWRHLLREPISRLSIRLDPPLLLTSSKCRRTVAPVLLVSLSLPLFLSLSLSLLTFAQSPVLLVSLSLSLSFSRVGGQLRCTFFLSLSPMRSRHAHVCSEPGSAGFSLSFSLFLPGRWSAQMYFLSLSLQCGRAMLMFAQSPVLLVSLSLSFSFSRVGVSFRQCGRATDIDSCSAV
jgi:hypothetical protein